MMKRKFLSVLAIAFPFALFSAHPVAAWQPELVMVDPEVRFIQLSPDGKWMLNMSSGTRNKLISLPSLKKATFSAHVCGWTADNRIWSSTEPAQVVSTNQKNYLYSPVVRVFAPAKPKNVLVLKDKFQFQNDGPVYDVLSQDGRVLTVVTRFWLRRFDGRSGRLLQRIKWRPQGIPVFDNFFSFSPDAQHVLFQSEPGLGHWNLHTKKHREVSGEADYGWFLNNEHYVLDEGKPRGTTLHHASDGKQVVLPSLLTPSLDVSGCIPLIGEHKIDWFNLKSGRVVGSTRRPDLDVTLIPTSYSPDHQWAYTLEKGGIIRRWRLK